MASCLHHRGREPRVQDGLQQTLTDHRAVKRITRPIQGFKDFRCALIILGGVELMHMIRKGQMRDDGRGLSAAQQFYMLAA
jgi:putative transposase